MINWFKLFANSLWIAALAVALSTISFADWEAKFELIKIKEIIISVPNQRKLTTASFLFCLGLGFISSSLEMAAWLAMSILFLVQLVTLIRRNAKGIK